jgi:hypothetical protein
VRGAVRDATGVVPGVDVVLFNEETNTVRTSTTNAVGEYAFPNVLPGAYTITAALAGFKTFKSRGIRIGTHDALTLDLFLEIGEVRETVIVTGTTPVVEKASASVSAVLDQASLETLPNPGRNPFVLSTIAPTVIPTGSPQFVRMQDHNLSTMLSVAGGPRRANNYLLDGVPIGDLFNRAAIAPSIYSTCRSGRPCCSRFRTPSSGSRSLARSPRQQPSRGASCCVPTRSSATCGPTE